MVGAQPASGQGCCDLTSHLCYARSMGAAAVRDLRNDTRGVLDRVANGEHVTITVQGRPVAILSPVPSRTTWLSKGEFVRRILPAQADPGLAHDLSELTHGETTDDARR